MPFLGLIVCLVLAASLTGRVIVTGMAVLLVGVAGRAVMKRAANTGGSRKEQQ